MQVMFIIIQSSKTTKTKNKKVMALRYLVSSLLVRTKDPSNEGQNSIWVLFFLIFYALLCQKYLISDLIFIYINYMKTKKICFLFIYLVWVQFNIQIFNTSSFGFCCLLYKLFNNLNSLEKEKHTVVTFSIKGFALDFQSTDFGTILI